MKRLFSLSLFFLLLFTACSSLPPADPERADSLKKDAARAIFANDFPGAIAKLDEALLYDPSNPVLYRQKAEVQETLQNFAGAEQTYVAALKRIPKDYAEFEAVRYHYGLVLARDIGKHRKARRQLEKIADKSRRHDLEGLIALVAGDPATALVEFGKALKNTTDMEQQARIYYHASLAHYKRDEIIESKNALFDAVNRAGGLALKQHIRIFFEKL